VPQARGLAKDHKPEFPECKLRIIQPNPNSPIEKLDWFLSRILGQLTAFIPSYVKSTADFIRRVGEVHLPSDCFQFSLDVVDLYPSISIGLALESIGEDLLENGNKITMFGLHIADVTLLLEFVLKHTITSFGKYAYQQRHGVAIGSHCGRIVADLVLKKVEMRIIHKFANLCVMYLRYVDDTYGIWVGSVIQWFALVDELNASHPDIGFTWERQNEDGKINFLDLTCTLEHERVEFTLYRKPTAADTYLSWESHVSSEVKAALVKGEAARIRRNCSTDAARSQALDEMRTRFERSGFPADFVQRNLKIGKRRIRGPARAFLRIPFISDGLTGIDEEIGTRG